MSNKPNRPAGVHIPHTKLRAELDETAALKRAMLEQLRELESHAAGRPIARPGAWRHDPTGWAERNLSPIAAGYPSPDHPTARRRSQASDS